MSYKLRVLNNVLHLKYSGFVDALDLIQVVKDPEFLPQISRYKKAIYDFTETEEIDLNFEETKRFSTLANVEANFIDNAHFVIVLSGPEGRARAEHYRNEITAPGWRVDIVETLVEAIDLIEL